MSAQEQGRPTDKVKSVKPSTLSSVVDDESYNSVTTPKNIV